MRILLKEHKSTEISRAADPALINGNCVGDEIFSKIDAGKIRVFKRDRGKDMFPFSLLLKSLDVFSLRADYYIGVDWLVQDHKFVQVAPKLNQDVVAAFEATTGDEVSDAQQETLRDVITDDKDVEIDYLRMLLDIMSDGLPAAYTDNLVVIDWHTSPIPVTQQDDRLTPFLVVRFLQLLKTIVQKGLKKSYYKVRGNLTNRVKGKILVGEHVKKNIFKNRSTKTYCEYQVFGTDSVENRFLKKVLRFATGYVENNKAILAENAAAVEHLLRYCRPAFEDVGDEVNEHQLKQIRYNPLFKEYKEAISTGRQILRKFAYNLSETAKHEVKTPPFWIDMPKLFELYCYTQLLRSNPKDRASIHYQFSTYGNALDILISKEDFQMVVDAKYKLHYSTGQVHSDIRQVAGYARLKKVREKLKISDDQNITCLIIYPDVKKKGFSYSLTYMQQHLVPINAYHKVYKLGVPLPVINQLGN